MPDFKRLLKLYQMDAFRVRNILHFTFSFMFVFRQRRDQQEAFFVGIFKLKAAPQHRSQRALNFVVNLHQSQA